MIVVNPSDRKCQTSPLQFQHDCRASFCSEIKQSVNTHRTDFVGYEFSNRAFNITPPMDRHYEGQPAVPRWNSMEKLRDLAMSLMAAQGECFNLNEYPEECEHKLYIDIDAPLSREQLTDIASSLQELTDGGKADGKVLINNNSGKVHLIMDVEITTYRYSKLRKLAIYAYLRDYLFDACMDSYFTREEWNKAFDATAMGIRAAFSIKVQNGKVRNDVYVPLQLIDAGADISELTYEEKAALIAEYSIYAPCKSRWASHTLAAFDAKEEEMEIARAGAIATAANMQDNYCAAKKTVRVDGIDVPVTQALIDNCVECLPPWRARDWRWRLVTFYVRQASQLVDSFNPDYFLHEWSRIGSSQEYNHDNNASKYLGVKLDRAKAGRAITWLCDAAMQGKPAALLAFIRNRPLIFEDTSMHFGQYVGYCIKYNTYQDMAEKVHRFIRGTVAYIVGLGSPFYITKNTIDGQEVFSICKAIKVYKGSVSWTENDKVKAKSTKFCNIVESIHEQIKFDRVDFMPYRADEHDPAPRGVFNMFTGFIAKNLASDGPVDYAPIEPILRHMREVLAAGSEELFVYIANWLAHVVQCPREKSGVAIAFKSAQGVGKNIFTDFLVRHVIGPKCAITVNDIEQIIGRFNVCIENKVLTVCDEVGNYGGNHKANDKLKSLITQSDQIIERKGIDPITVHDYNNLIMQSNNDWHVRIEASDRRYVAIECDPKYIGNAEYFSQLAAAMTPENGNLFMTWLLARDISGWNRRVIPDTKLRRELKVRAIDTPIQFLISLVGDADNRIVFGPEIKLSTTALYRHYCTWAAENGMANNGGYTERTFALAINKVIKTQKIRIGDKTMMGLSMDKAIIIDGLSKKLNITPQELEELM